MYPPYPVDATPSVGPTEADDELPDEFDARDGFPGCVRGVRDQGRCGAYAAMAAADILSDRICIASHGKSKLQLAPQYLLSCDKSQLGCRGGWPERTWDFTTKTDIPTEKCVPYVSGAAGAVPPCPLRCKDQSGLVLYKSKGLRRLRGVAQMQNEIYRKGPIEATFTLFQVRCCCGCHE